MLCQRGVGRLYLYKELSSTTKMSVATSGYHQVTTSPGNTIKQRYEYLVIYSELTCREVEGDAKQAHESLSN